VERLRGGEVWLLDERLRREIDRLDYSYVRVTDYDRVGPIELLAQSGALGQRPLFNPPSPTNPLPEPCAAAGIRRSRDSRAGARPTPTARHELTVRNLSVSGATAPVERGGAPPYLDKVNLRTSYAGGVMARWPEARGDPIERALRPSATQTKVRGALVCDEMRL